MKWWMERAETVSGVLPAIATYLDGSSAKWDSKCWQAMFPWSELYRSRIKATLGFYFYFYFFPLPWCLISFYSLAFSQTRTSFGYRTLVCVLELWTLFCYGVKMGAQQSQEYQILFFFFKVVEELHLVESFVLNQGTSTIHQMSHWPYTGLVEQVCVEHDLHICFFFFFSLSYLGFQTHLI